MGNSGYVTLTRQTGLTRELQVLANNIANSATTGFRSEGLIFSEYVKRVDGAPSLSMATANTKRTSQEQGTLTNTGAQFDFAIEGDGFFLIETPQGERLTRAGAFSLSAAGDLVTNDGYPVLDSGGAPVFVPPDVADIAVGADGTISSGGRLLGQLGIVRPIEGTTLIREDGVMFKAQGEYEPDSQSHVFQGFLESANVNPVLEVARLVEVQRAYEMGQSFLDSENDRINNALKTFIK